MTQTQYRREQVKLLAAFDSGRLSEQNFLQALSILRESYHLAREYRRIMRTTLPPARRIA